MQTNKKPYILNLSVIAALAVIYLHMNFSGTAFEMGSDPVLASDPGWKIEIDDACVSCHAFGYLVIKRSF